MLLPLLFLALAPDDTVKRQEIPLLLRPFEITTSRSLGLVAKSTVSLEKIDSKKVFLNGGTQFSDVIDRVPGVTITNGQANIRGGSGFTFGVGSRVLMLVDGLPMLGAYEGDIRWHFLPMEQVQSVEVLKGAASAVYGSSALNGVIHLQTLWASEKKPIHRVWVQNGMFDRPPQEHVDLFPNDRRMTNAVSWVSAQKWKKWDFVLGGQALKDESYRNSDFANRLRGNAKIRYTNGRFQAGVSANAMRDSAGVFFIWKSDSMALTQYMDTTVSQVLRYFTLDPYVQYNGKVWRHALKNRVFYNLNRSELYEYTSAYRKDHFSAVFGAFHQKNVNLFRDSIHSVNRALFGQLSYSWKSFAFQGGVRYEQFINLNKSPISSPVFRGGVNYRWKENHFFRASWGQGFRSPTLIEMYVKTSNNTGGINIFPNPTLRSEFAHSSELGYRYEKENQSFVFDVALFFQQYRDMIEFSYGFNFNSGLFGFGATNISKARIYGFDVQAKGFQSGGKWRLDYLAGVTRTEPLNLGTDTVTSTQWKYLKYRQKWLGRADLQLTYGKWMLGGNFRWNGFMESIDRPWVEQLAGTIPGIQAHRELHPNGDFLLDVRLKTQLNSAWSLGMVVRNALNQSVMMVPGSLGPYRQFMLQLIWE